MLAVENARVWPGPDDDPISRATIVVRDQRIEEVGPHVRTPSGATVIDARGATVIAGMWNAHVHLTEPKWSRARRTPAEELAASLRDMFTSHGFTTVADLASDPRSTLPLKARIDSGEVPGPRIYTAGSAIHPARGLPFYVRESVPRYLWVFLDTPWTSWGARRAVRRNLRRGAELVKLFTGSYVTPTTIKPMRVPVARAAVEVARAYPALVFAHTSNREGLEVALRAGVDVIAHVPDETEGTVPLLREAARHGVVMVPTLQMFARTVTESRDYLEPIYAALREFHAAGGRLMFGTDVGYMRDYTIDFELDALRRCGLDGRDVLRMLTTTPAEVFGVADHVGRIAPGQDGDLIVLDGDPTVDGGAFARVRTTVRAGREI